MKIRVIVNPSAAAGGAGRKIPELSRLLRARGLAADIVTTKYPGDATSIARDSATDVDVLAVMGGDGTFNEVAQAFVQSDGRAAFGPSLAFLPAGTGGDLKRSLGLTNDLEAAIERIALARCSPVDVGLLTTTDGTLAPIAFLNVASFGLSAAVCRLANRGPKWMGGKVTFYTAALRATLTYRNQGVRVLVDAASVYAGPAYLVALANGGCFGGGMKIAPDARIDDGLLDVVVLGDYSRLQAIGLSRAIYVGTHLQRTKTTVARGRIVELQPLAETSDVPMETDGELPPLSLPVRAEVFPSAIRVCR